MSRLLTLAIVAALVLPAQAEAARFRFGAAKRISPPATASVPAPAASSRTGFAAGVGTGLVLRPRSVAGGESQPEIGNASWSRMPTAPALAPQPAAVMVGGTATRKPWCGGQTVIGGFCVLN